MNAFPLATVVQLYTPTRKHACCCACGYPTTHTSDDPPRLESRYHCMPYPRLVCALPSCNSLAAGTITPTNRRTYSGGCPRPLYIHGNLFVQFRRCSPTCATISRQITFHSFISHCLSRSNNFRVAPGSHCHHPLSGYSMTYLLSHGIYSNASGFA